MRDKIKHIQENKLISSYSFINCSKNYIFKDKYKSIITCLKSQSPSIGTFIREKNKDFTKSFLVNWFESLKKYNVEINQIDFICESIINEYYNFKISDLTYLSQVIIKKNYNKVTEVLSLFDKYFEYRCNVAAELSRNLSINYKV